MRHKWRKKLRHLCRLLIVSRQNKMLNTKEIYNAARHNLSLVQWQRTGESEWIFVGDSDYFKSDLLLSVLEQVFPAEPIYAVQSRDVVIECSPSDAVNFTQERLKSGPIWVCNRKFSKYVQIEPMGVYRYGVLPAN